MKAYKHLIKHCLSMGCTVSVWDGGCWQVKRCTAFKTIIEAIESVEEAKIRIRQKGAVIGSALISAYGLADDETVTDYSCTSFMEEWEEIYKQSGNNKNQIKELGEYWSDYDQEMINARMPK